MIPRSTIAVSGAPAASQALVDLATLKSDLGISDGSQDARLTRIIAASAAAIAKYCGRIFIRQSYLETWRLPPATSMAWAGVMPLDPVPALPAGQWPVVSIASVVEAGTTLSSSLYMIAQPLDPAQPGRGFVRLDASGAESAWAAGIIAVTYNAGFDPMGTASPSSPMPADLYEAALIDARARFTAKDFDFARTVVREEVPDVYAATYDLSGGLDALGGAPGSYGLAAAAMVLLDAYRAPRWAT